MAGGEQARAAGVLRTFLRDGRLLALPAARGKRRVVLDLLAGRFEPGRRYPDAEVDAVLAGYLPGPAGAGRPAMAERMRQPWNVAEVKRYLVEEGFLGRTDDGAEYWRTGGTVDLG